ncbi:hypothetical protein D3C72_2336210 [compost metagenome]
MERTLHALVAHIAGDRRLEVADGDLGLSAAKRPLAARAPGDEDPRLKTFERLGCPGQRGEHVHGQIDEQAERGGVDQRIGVSAGKDLGEG